MVKAVQSLLFIFLLFTCGFADETKKEVRSVWGATVPSTFMIYIVNPDSLAGWHGKLYDYESKFILDKYKSLPILGSWHNEGGIPDKEMLLRERVKKAFLIATSNHSPANMKPDLDKMGIQTVVMDGNNLNDYIVMFRKLGDMLGVPQRGEELAVYCENALKTTRGMVKDIKDSERPRVYVADRMDGLTTGCNIEVLDIVGGINVFQCDDKNSTAYRKFSFEQIMNFDPDVIFITDPKFSQTYKDDPKWHRLRAYKTGRMYVVPYGPFGWMDKPAALRFTAMQWMACKLYPDRCTVDMDAETKKFMKLFFAIDIDNATLAEILQK